jgi:RND family efflux transporter MFP subunit
MKKRVLLAAAVLLGAVAAWQIFQKISPSPATSPAGRGAPVAVETAPVTTGPITEEGIFTGTLMPESQYTVAPKVAGKLEKILVNIGDRVTRNQLIALQDDAEYLQQVGQAKAELDVAVANVEENRSALNLAKREFERARALREKKIVSESELDAAEAQFKAALAKQKVAEAQVAQKEAALKAAEVRLGYTRILAVWDGGPDTRVVGERFVDGGTMLAANAPIATILQIDPLTAVIHVIEKDYPSIRTGQSAVLQTDAYPGKTFPGAITRIAPLLKESARQARVEITVPNREEFLKPGMFVRVRIEFSRKESATLVPANALIRRNGSQGIFLADRETGKARFVPVTVGITSGETAEILDPAVSGLVVTVGQHLLEDGASILLPGGSGQPSRQDGSTEKRTSGESSPTA